MKLIDINKLSVGYGGQQVLKEISLSLDGGVASILGANGAGKSTLLKCVLRLIENYSGTIKIGGRDIATLSRRELSRLVSYVPQSASTAYAYSVSEMVTMGALNWTTSERRQVQRIKCDAALEQVGIMKLREQKFTRISGGERQLTLIARALFQDAPVMVLDEPTANLDYGNAQRVLAVINRISQSAGRLTLMTTHHPEHALNYSSSVIALKDGRIHAMGAPRDVIDTDLIYALYAMRSDVVITKYGSACVPRIEK